MKKFILIPILALLIGCATLQPGADPFVVKVEQTQTMAYASFDVVLHMDQANRSFWKTNAPGFHQFCEWLRTPTPYDGQTLGRAVVMQLNVSDLKKAYKSSKTVGSSNVLFSAWYTLNAAINQANSWSNIITSPIHP